MSGEAKGGTEHKRFGDFLSPEVDSKWVYEGLEDKRGNGVGKVGGSEGGNGRFAGPEEEEGLRMEPK